MMNQHEHSDKLNMVPGHGIEIIFYLQNLEHPKSGREKEMKLEIGGLLSAQH